MQYQVRRADSTGRRSEISPVGQSVNVKELEFEHENESGGQGLSEG